MSSQDPAAFGGPSFGDEDPRQRPLLVDGEHEDFASVTQAVSGIPEVELQKTNKAWIACFMVSLGLLGVLGAIVAGGTLAGAWAARGVYRLDVPAALDEGG